MVYNNLIIDVGRLSKLTTAVPPGTIPLTTDATWHVTDVAWYAAAAYDVTTHGSTVDDGSASADAATYGTANGTTYDAARYVVATYDAATRNDGPTSVSTDAYGRSAYATNANGPAANAYGRYVVNADAINANGRYAYAATHGYGYATEANGLR